MVTLAASDPNPVSKSPQWQRANLKRAQKAMGTGAIREYQVPNSRAEATFKGKAAEHGWIPHRPSWPDFLVEIPGLGLVAVEVKDKDTISSEQRRTFDLLTAAGLPVYLWRRGDESLRRWGRPSGGSAEPSRPRPQAQSRPADLGEDPKGAGLGGPEDLTSAPTVSELPSASEAQLDSASAPFASPRPTVH
jgi:hypothetical protein